ncbi:glycosyltransferase family 2 protein [Streptomyces sp. TRM66268-LWL]|uniref:Glycosyltransferase family 2 protein n=1 Tax=Streptomyces polyasparticus TaxID=2767826 RepID=A0ABR7SLC3_9ACTN|nr:glycosyltransferase family 2 protein [Streptomyces polyasparticus]
MPYLVDCLKSVEAQTLGADRMEIVAVDDGSTDGTGAYLDEFAAASPIPTRVIHQENSGGPSGPRNVGLAEARGRYVFFLDADDYFGPEALERMVAMGDRNGTDVVLGKVVGVNRGAPKSMWRRSLDRTDVFSSNIKFTLSAQKLFRRELLVRHGMRFDESLKTGEDALFTMEAYLRADGVSVVADYVCYHLVGRTDGVHVTKSGSYTLRFDSARALMKLIEEHVPAGSRRDSLMIRPFLITLLPQFGPGFLKQSAEVRRHKLELAEPLLDAYWSEGVSRRMKVHERLRLHLVAEGREDLLCDVLEFLRDKRTPEVFGGRDGRTYLGYPHFRDGDAGVPDRYYAVTTKEMVPADRIQWPTSSRARIVRGLRRSAGAVLRRTVRRPARPVSVPAVRAAAPPAPPVDEAPKQLAA